MARSYIHTCDLLTDFSDAVAIRKQLEKDFLWDYHPPTSATVRRWLEAIASELRALDRRLNELERRDAISR